MEAKVFPTYNHLLNIWHYGKSLISVLLALEKSAFWLGGCAIDY